MKAVPWLAVAVIGIGVNDTPPGYISAQILRQCQMQKFLAAVTVKLTVSVILETPVQVG